MYQSNIKVEQINELLPGANCGGCGYAGCAALAEAIAAGKAPVNACNSVSDDVIEQIAIVMGVKAEKNTAKEPYSLYICSTLSSLSTCFLKRNLNAGRPPQQPIAKPTAPPIADASVQIVA